MKILVYGINFAPELTGVGKYTAEMVADLCGRGHDVRVVTAPPYYPDWRVAAGYSSWTYRADEELLDSGSDDGEVAKYTVYRCPLYVPQRPTGARRILHLASFVLSSMPVMLWQAAWRPDIVWVVEPSLMCLPSSILTARMARAKLWLHIQDFEVDAAFSVKLIRMESLQRFGFAMERFLMKFCDRISTISSRMLSKLVDKGVPEEKCLLVSNWVDTELIRPLQVASPFRQELGLAESDVVALYSGNMGYKQCLELVVEAARSLSRNRDIKFVMCGNGAAYPDIRAKANGLDNIIWLPLQPVERLNDLLNLADIHLLPQCAGAADLVMPSKLTGILASGRPVVATAEEGTEVWTVVSGCGYNTSPGDADAFAKAIEAFAADPASRRRAGEAGRKYAVEYLSSDVVLSGFNRELNTVVRISK